MSSPFITTAIRDVAPTLSEPYPQELKRAIDNFYNSSKHQIPLKQNEEIARYHICAVMAINRLKQEKGFLEPAYDKSPLPTKMFRQLVDLFEANLQTKSAVTTPVSTPQKKRVLNKVETPTPSPARKRGRPPSAKKLLLVDRLEALNTQDPTSAPFTSPTKLKTPKSQRTPHGSPSKSSPLKSTGSTAYSSPSKHMNVLSASEITALCNKFQLETNVIENVLDTFKQYCNKVSNEWVLLCGLIINCYFVINHEVISEKVGSRSNVIKTMFSLQNGGLMLDEVNKSITIVQNLISHNKWFKQLKIKYDLPFDEETIASTSGNMISKSAQFLSERAQHDQKAWIESVRHEISTRSNSKTNELSHY